VRGELSDAGVHVVLTPFQAPTANAYAESSCGRLSTSASIGSCRWVSAISVGPSRNSSITTIANGIIKGSRIGSLRGARRIDVPAGFDGVRGSVAC
jgi:hypothetical protein